MANGGRIEIGVGFKVDKSSLNDILNSLTQVMRQANFGSSSSSGLNKGLKEAGQTASHLYDILTKCYNTNLGTINIQKFNKELKAANLTMQSLQTKLAAGGNSGALAYNKMASSILSTNVRLKESNKMLDSMATTLKDSFKYTVSYGIVNQITGAVKEAVQYVEKLDKSLNRIRIVTGQTTEQMAEFAKQANIAAQALGTKTTSYTDASLIYFQQGLSAEEVTERTNATIKMANVLGESSSQISSYMTAIWNNFDDGSKSLEYYGDVITNLGAHTASSAAEISAGIEKFAAVAETAGLSYEYATTALATVVAETRQSADTVGTAFKTLFARIQDLELGETLDDGTTLGKYSQALAAIGVNIKTSTGEVKSMNAILDEMGDKWAGLAQDTKIAVAQAVAGRKRIMSNLVLA